MKTNLILGTAVLTVGCFLFACKPQAPETAAVGDAASRVYVAPGK